MLKTRNLQPTDFQDLVANYYSFYDELAENPTLGLALFNEKLDMAEELEWFANLFRSVSRGDAVAAVAEVEHRAVGLCEVVRLRSRDAEVGHRGELGLAIRKEYRSEGIGSALLSETIQRCRGKFEVIELDVFSTNQVAIELYKKYGFKEVRLRPRSIKRSGRFFDEHLMSLVL